MQISVTIVGDRALSAELKQYLQRPDHALVHYLHQQGMQCVLRQVEELGGADDLPAGADQMHIVVLPARDQELLRRAGRMASAWAKGQRGRPPVRLVLVFERQHLLHQQFMVPGFAFDWVSAEAGAEELLHRMLCIVSQQRAREVRARQDEVRLISETSSVAFRDQSVKLTPTEFVLAELFLARLGAVVPLSDLAGLFKAGGNSDAANNIRVAICQLRLKLGVLRQARLSLLAVYRKGYCLRQVAGRPA